VTSKKKDTSSLVTIILLFGKEKLLPWQGSMLPQLWASLFTLSTEFLEMNKLPLETIHPTVNDVSISTVATFREPITNVVKKCFTVPQILI
jgi:hypothetical protein